MQRQIDPGTGNTRICHMDAARIDPNVIDLSPQSEPLPEVPTDAKTQIVVVGGGKGVGLLLALLRTIPVLGNHHHQVNNGLHDVPAGDEADEEKRQGQHDGHQSELRHVFAFACAVGERRVVVIDDVVNISVLVVAVTVLAFIFVILLEAA